MNQEGGEAVDTENKGVLCHVDKVEGESKHGFRTQTVSKSSFLSKGQRNLTYVV